MGLVRWNVGIRHHDIAVPSQSILTQKITLPFLRLSGALFDTTTKADPQLCGFQLVYLAGLFFSLIST